MSGTIADRRTQVFMETSRELARLIAQKNRTNVQEKSGVKNITNLISTTCEGGNECRDCVKLFLGDDFFEPVEKILGQDDSQKGGCCLESLKDSVYGEDSGDKKTCGGNGGCVSLVENLISKDTPLRPGETEESRNFDQKFFDNLKNKVPYTMSTACFGLCACVVDGVVQMNENDLIFQADIDVDGLDFVSAAKNVNDSLDKKYGSADDHTEEITKIMKSATSQFHAEIHQFAASTLTIGAKGSGITVSHIKERMVLTGCMKAVINSAGSLSNIDSIVADMVKTIQNKITKDSTDSFSQIFQKSRGYFEVMGILLLLAFLSYPAMIVFKAYTGQK